MSHPSSRVAADELDRAKRVGQLVNECLQRRARGEEVSDQSLIDAHPELMPELAQQLRNLQMIQEAQRQADTPPAGPATVAPRGLRIRCPHCRNPLEIAEDSSLSDLLCPSCGRHFSLVDEAERTFQASRHQQINHFQLLDKVGADVADWLTDQKPTPREAAQLCATVADALAHAHDHGVIHRDLKPSNIMLDTSGEPHLMDFGLAKREAGEMTVTMDGKLLGTPAYMSPEQARGTAHDADARSDVYSLGVILFELLTGERPFRGSTHMVLHQVLMEDAPSPRKLNHSVPRDLETICLKCLEKDPSRRYQTAGDLRDDLKRFLSGEPVHARPITRAARAGHWCKRKPVVAGLSAAVASLLLFLAVAGPIVAKREADAHRDAQAARSQAEQESEHRRRLLYCSDMHRAQTDWLAGHVDSVLNLLERHYPRTGQVDLRGFEWYHLWRNCRQTVMAPTLQAGGSVGDILFSPDGKTVTTVSSSERSSQTFVDIKQWNALTRATIDEHSVPLKAIGVQRLSADRKWVAVAHSDGKVTLINLTTGELRQLSGLANQVWSLAFSPDGHVLAGGDAQGGVKTWTVTGGHELAPIEPHKDTVYCVAFSPDGRILASGSRGEKRMAKLSDVETGKMIREFDHAQYGSVWSAAFSPDGKLLATGTSLGIDGDYSAILWNVESGKLIHKLPVDSFVTAVAFSRDGANLASASGDRRVSLWDVQSGDFRQTLNGNDGRTRAIAFSPDGKVLACPGEHGNVRLWPLDAPSGVSVLKGHHDNVFCLSFSPDGRTLASASFDKTLVLWDVATGTEKFRLWGHEGEVFSVAFSPTGEALASASSDNTVKLWEAATGKLLDSFPHETRVVRVAYSPSGRLLATGQWDGTVTIWNLASREQLSIVKADPQALSSLVFSRHGKTLTTTCHEWLTQAEDTNVKLWNVQEILELRETMPCEFAVVSLAYSSDERFLALGGDGLKLTDLVHHAEIRNIRRGFDVRSLAFSRNGRTLISSGPGTVAFWDTADGDLRFELIAHLDAIESIALSPDGKTLATGSNDDIVKLWRAATDEEVELMRRTWLETRR
jgi:WD40 repeat protein